MEELVEMGKRHDLPVIYDLGSGALVDLAQFGIESEPTVQQAMAAGADVTSFSGDKLLAGLRPASSSAKRICGRHEEKSPYTGIAYRQTDSGRFGSHIAHLSGAR